MPGIEPDTVNKSWVYLLCIFLRCHGTTTNLTITAVRMANPNVSMKVPYNGILCKWSTGTENTLYL